MSLKDAFQKAAQTAFVAAGNVPTEVRYDSYVTAVNNTSTGVVEPQYDRYMVSFVFEAYADHHIDGNRTVYGDTRRIMAGDKKAIIPSLNLPVTPTVRDRMAVLEDGVWRKHTVEDKNIDPAGALWELRVRRTG